MNCCVSDEMDGKEDDVDVGNVGSEHKTVRSERETDDGNC
jgi:hypothetical protein